MRPRLIDDHYLSLDKPLWDLVETCFDGISYNDLCFFVDQNLADYATKLESMLSIDTTDFTHLLKISQSSPQVKK